MEQQKILDIIQQWKANPRFIVEMLSDIQTYFGFIPIQAVQLLEQHTKLAQVRIYHLAQYPNNFIIK
jgi:hypothetical protein